MMNRSPTAQDVVLTATSLALTLATAYIHSTLGGALFTLNAIGYLGWAVALVVPISIVARHRWLVRIGLAGYAATTVAAWLIQPTYYSTAYLAKAIELALIGVLTVDFVRRNGNRIERVRSEVRSLLGQPQGPASGRA
jgi:hypothetical protein